MCNYAFTQDYLGIKQSNYAGILGADLNPASIADNRYKFDMLIMGISTSFYNNYLYFNTRNMPYGWIQSFNTNNQPSEFWLQDTHFFDNNFGYVKNPNEKGRSFHYTSNIDIASFLLSINPKIAIGFGSKLRSYTNIGNVSPSLIRLAENAFDYSTLWNLDLNDLDLNISSNTWIEFYFNYAQTILDIQNHYIKVGGRIKFLKGFASAYFYSDNLEYNFQNNNTLNNLTGTIQYGYSNSFSIENQLIRNKEKRSKLGFGFDLGVEYEWRPKWENYKYEMDGKDNLWMKNKNKYKAKLGISLLDIGGMTYSEADETFDLQFHSNNLDLSIFENISSPEDFDSIAAVLDQTGQATLVDHQEKYYMNLPSALSIQADYNIWKDFYVNANLHWGLKLNNNANKVISYSIFSITPRYDYKFAGISFPVSFSGVNGFRTGLGIRLGPVIIGTADLKPISSPGNDRKIRGANIYTALKIPILYRHPKDLDSDKVSDKLDECPKTPGLWEFLGCPWPDTDEDGIIDKDDKCPYIFGPSENEGCPYTDTDGDGITDKEDDCVNIPGAIENNGCPWQDSDNDGVIDKDDKCPDIPGQAENDGCPYLDSDQDGLIDKEDQCPYIPGPPENKGCPYTDTDGDGVIDKNDLCINTPGPAENKGCPVLEKEEQEILNTAFNNLEFETGKAVIKAISYPSLEELSNLLIKKQEWKLLISGHTDNIGSEKSNLILSKKRSESVRDFLYQYGINQDRFIVQYFGESKPIKSNENVEGRQENRRVELNIIFD